jgi:hypothetical protein
MPVLHHASANRRPIGSNEVPIDRGHPCLFIYHICSVGVGVGVAQLKPKISYFSTCFGYQMNATSIKEYQNKCQPDMSLYLETAWTERTAHISKKCFLFNFGFVLPVHAVSIYSDMSG